MVKELIDWGCIYCDGKFMNDDLRITFGKEKLESVIRIGFRNGKVEDINVYNRGKNEVSFEIKQNEIAMTINSNTVAKSNTIVKPYQNILESFISKPYFESFLNKLYSNKVKENDIVEFSKNLWVSVVNFFEFSFPHDFDKELKDSLRW